ncbi:hypothetical protein [Streptomyces anulatus]|uniref:hypothetical protein n=1 Tax=Streptomyces anulatus TaxID=1892 RepID=UPI002F90AD87|nr:hypothetical protein OG238_42085 [Streptomyces anulatus]
MTEHTPRRIYGADHDDSDPYATTPGHDVELVGGPLDGQLLDVTALTPRSAYGPGGRADYEPRPGCATRWDWSGDVPW